MQTITPAASPGASRGRWRVAAIVLGFCVALAQPAFAIDRTCGANPLTNTTNALCAAGTCTVVAGHVTTNLDLHRFCTAGPNVGLSCSGISNCGGCAAGANAGAVCTASSQCPGSTCTFSPCSGCVFDLGGRILEIRRTVQMIGGGGQIDLMNAGNVLLTDTAKLKARGDEVLPAASRRPEGTS